MDVGMFKELFAYNRWANARVWACVTPLSEAQFTEATDYSLGSVHQQLVHTMDAESMWLKRLNGFSPPAFVDPADFPTRESIRAEWDRVEADVIAYLDQLDEAHLSDEFTFRSINGNRMRTMPVWQGLIHMVNHSTDHRAQTLAQIHRVGGATVAQDIVFYSWEQRGQPAP